ncbi:MAG: hypothetical protein ACRED2_00110 [Methylocella sp.]
MANTGFPPKAEFPDLSGFEKAHDDVDPLPSPTRNLAVEPIARARARYDRQTSAGGLINPINFGAHRCAKASTT